VTHPDLAALASEAGFGGQQRNTLAVKLKRFAELLKKAHYLEAERMGEVNLHNYNKENP